jgi:hypothetical protein
MKDYSDLKDFCEKNNIPLATKIIIAYRKNYLSLCNKDGKIIATDNVSILNASHVIHTVTDLLNEIKDKSKEIYISFHTDGFYYDPSSSGNSKHVLGGK